MLLARGAPRLPAGEAPPPPSRRGACAGTRTRTIRVARQISPVRGRGSRRQQQPGAVRVLSERPREAARGPGPSPQAERQRPDVLGWDSFDTGRFCIVSELGRGAFGTVVEAEDEERGDAAVAVKIMSKLRQGQTPAQTANKIRWEGGLLQRVQRETDNVVRALGFYEDPINAYVVMERLPGGTLQDYLKSKGGRLPEQEVRWIARDVLSFVAACHASNIVYADAKPANFMLDRPATPSGPRPTIKAIDMGCSQPCPSGSYIPMCSGTLMFTAPEVLREKKCGHESDIWSCGIMLYIMLSGTNPFYDPIAVGKLGLDDLKEIIEEEEPLFRDSDWYDIDPVARDLVELMLCRDPEMRISARGALMHEWFSEEEEEEEEEGKAGALSLAGGAMAEAPDPEERLTRAAMVLDSMDDNSLDESPSHLL